jgi:hypothetical protein
MHYHIVKARIGNEYWKNNQRSEGICGREHYTIGPSKNSWELSRYAKIGLLK